MIRMRAGTDLLAPNPTPDGHECTAVPGVAGPARPADYPAHPRRPVQSPTLGGFILFGVGIFGRPLGSFE